MYLVEVSQLPDKKTGVPRTVIIGAGAAASIPLVNSPNAAARWF